MKTLKKNKFILFVDDEREMGNSLIVTLVPGYAWSEDKDLSGSREHVRGFDQISEVRDDLKFIIKCKCSSCRKALGIE